MKGRRATLDQFSDQREDRADLDELTEAEREVFKIVDVDEEMGPRPLARKTGRSPGTISNLLRRARRKAGVQEAT